MTNAPANDSARREALFRRLGELDARTLGLFSSISALAARLADAPFAAIALAEASLVRYTATTGFPEQAVPHAETFCARALEEDSFLMVPDARADARFKGIESVTGAMGVVFYAGLPLHADDGTAVGTLCILDTRPRDHLGALGRAGLESLARVVEEQIHTCLVLREAGELRRLHAEQEQILDAFARTSHSGYSLADAGGTIRRISGFTSHILGHPPEALVGGDLARMVPEPLKQTVRAQHAAVIEDGKTRSGVWKVLHREGRQRYMHICGERVFDAEGNPLVFSSMTDVTEDHLRTRLRRLRSRLLERLARDRSLPDVLTELLNDLSRYVANTVGVITEPADETAGILCAPELDSKQRQCLLELLHTPGSPPAQTRPRNWLTATPDLPASRTYTGGAIARQAGWRAMIWYPLRYTDGNQRGAIGFLRSTAEPFPESETELLADFVALVSTLMQTGRLLETMRHQAHHDNLTGLANRRLLKERTRAALHDRRRAGGDLAVLMLDLDNFKMVNDSLGHDAGDELLCAVAERLGQSVRREDTVARLGGDEFVVVAERTDRTGAEGIARKVMDALRNPVLLGGRKVTVRPSIGIALSGPDGTDADTLLRAADAAMYAAKAAGRNRYRFHGADLDHPIATRFQLQQELYQPEVRDQLVTEVEPRVGHDGRLVALECTSVWQHPAFGRIDRDTLLGLAHETGRLRLLEDVLVAGVTATLPQWQHRYPDVIVTARLAEMTLYDAGFPDRLAAYLERIGIPEERVEADITGAIAARDEALMASVRTLQARFPRMRLAVSDVGERSVPLLDLAELDIAAGRLSPRWLQTLNHADPNRRLRAQAMVAHLQELGAQIGMTLVAGGVETHAQWESARAVGIAQFQGPLFATLAGAEATAANGGH